MGKEEVEAFLTHLAVNRGVAPSVLHRRLIVLITAAGNRNPVQSAACHAGSVTGVWWIGTSRASGGVDFCACWEH